MPNILVTDKPNVLNPYELSFEERMQQLVEIERLEYEKKEREKQSPFSRWTQFNNKHTKELMKLALKYPRAHAILYFLVDQMDKYNAVICSYKVMEEVLCVTRQTISQNIKILKDHGFLVILKSGNANIYVINDKIYWKSWGTNRKFSKFPANVILGISEQEDELKINLKNVKSEQIKNVFLKKNGGAEN